ncbi:hypothetical protein HAX54_013191 [Datura stramonium]|uniref:Uncharacterized protein n=1 Tax=Datura stramonium TaxID=4076 RepID=A0ABS8TMH4_DATST|nr:hypothetical protein [Datura stramonium]
MKLNISSTFHWSKYAYEGLFKNAFEGLKIRDDREKFQMNMINGEDILRDTWQIKMDYSKWMDLVILLGMVVLYMILFLLFIKVGEKVKPTIRAFMTISSNEINSA